jgi:predicted ATP-binding protein involved in virulence
MRIDQLVLQNFKSFENRQFSFHPQMNLLVGVNGTGKTSVLDALAVATGGWFLGLRGYDTRHIRAHEIRLKAIPAQHTTANGQQGERVNWELQYPCSVEASGTVMEQQLGWKRSINTTRGRTTYVDARSIKDLASQTDADVRAGKDIVLPLVSYYGTGRLWDAPREQFRVKSERSFLRKQSRSRFMGYRNSVDPRISVPELSRWIAEQSWISFQQGGSLSITYAAVRTAILKCMEGATDLYFDPLRGEVVVEIEDQGLQPFSNLSDGQRTILGVVGDIAQKAATLNPHLEDKILLETPGIVIIDELDLHLHPRWQRRVIEDLRTVFPRIQFFASTHSPFLIQSLRSGEELIMLEGSPTAQLANKSLADIANGIMGVDNPDASQRYVEMKGMASHYLETLDKATLSPRDKLVDFQAELAKATTLYADNPAFQAFLEMKRAAKLGG